MIYTVTLNPSLDRTIHFPQVALGSLNRATRSQTDLSGKGVNVSIALRQLGVKSVITGLSAGVFGRILVEGLREQDYKCSFVEIAGETRSNVTVIDDETGITTKLNESGPPADESVISSFERRLIELVQPSDVVAFCGSLPPGAPADTYARLIEAVRSEGALTALDTSGPALREGCRAMPDLIKPNDQEAEALTGISFDAEHLQDGVRALLDLGPHRVLLSLGPRGAVYADGEAGWRGVPPRIREINAVGAGDASLAGLLYAWQQNVSAEKVVRWAVAAGTATAQRDGTTFPDLEKVEAVYVQVSIQQMHEQ